jgi:hypothetical protein
LGIIKKYQILVEYFVLEIVKPVNITAVAMAQELVMVLSGSDPIAKQTNSVLFVILRFGFDLPLSSTKQTTTSRSHIIS